MYTEHPDILASIIEFARNHVHLSRFGVLQVLNVKVGLVKVGIQEKLKVNISTCVELVSTNFEIVGSYGAGNFES